MNDTWLDYQESAYRRYRVKPGPKRVLYIPKNS